MNCSFFVRQFITATIVIFFFWWAAKGLGKFFDEPTSTRSFQTHGDGIEGIKFPNIGICNYYFVETDPTLLSCGIANGSFIDSVRHCLNINSSKLLKDDI